MLVLLLALVVAAGVEQLRRSVPVLAVHPDVPAGFTVPAARALPWPAGGTAAAGVAGIGTVGGVAADRPVPIASVTKVMTALVVLHDHPLRAGQSGPSVVMTAADVAAFQAGLRAQSSEVTVAAGERLSELQLLEALLVPSADDAADALARWDAGSVAPFVGRMNATAAALGLTATHYADPSGLQSRSVSSAADQLALAQVAMRQPVIARLVAMPSVTLPLAGTLFNFNSLVTHDGIVGMKTGSSVAAGGCVVLVGRRTVAGASRLVFAVVLGQRGVSILSAALTAARRLLDAVPRVVASRVVLAAGTDVGTVTGVQHRTAVLRLAAPVRLLTWPGLAVTYSLRTDVAGRHGAAAGARLGQLVARAGGQSVTVPAVLDRAVPAPTLGWRLRRLP